MGTVMPKALVVLKVSRFLVAANEVWPLRELQAESNFLGEEKQLDRHIALHGFIQLVS